MRALSVEPTEEELRRTFAKLRESLRPEILDEVLTGGFREAMIKEYQELARTSSALIKLLRRNGFADGLGGDEATEYETLLARFSHSGQRCRVLIEESSAVDEQALLAIAPDTSGSIN